MKLFLNIRIAAAVKAIQSKPRSIKSFIFFYHVHLRILVIGAITANNKEQMLVIEESKANIKDQIAVLNQMKDLVRS